MIAGRIVYIEDWDSTDFDTWNFQSNITGGNIDLWINDWLPHTYRQSPAFAKVKKQSCSLTSQKMVPKIVLEILIPGYLDLIFLWKQFPFYFSPSQRWVDCEIFQFESSPDPIKLNLIQSWSAKFLKIISPIQSWSANVYFNLSCIFFINFKSCISICLMRQKNHWSYFAFSQIRLVEGNILPAVLLPHEAK